MPLYEYRCLNCEETFEIRQKFADDPLTTHEKCGGKVERLLSAPGLQFKGSGWYITDYARSGKSEKKSESSTPAKTESKPTTPASS
jgi:putative FmdB family regulatory protein